MQEIRITNSAVRIIADRLVERGYRVWLVGGALRDLLIGLHPKHWDIATDATPEEVREVFPDAIPVGERFSCVQVELSEFDPVQITTLRADDITEDLSRRDFTFNAMALPLDSGELSISRLIDPFNGMRDLKDHILASVGDPRERFREDPLRMLRAIRFAQHTSSVISPDTFVAIKDMSHRIQDVSLERIRQEIEGILLPRRIGAPVDLAIVHMRDLGLLSYIFPSLDATSGVEQNPRWHEYDVFTHTMKSLSHSPENLRVRLAILYHDVGKPLVRSLSPDGVPRFHGHEKESARLAFEELSRLTFPVRLVKDVSTLVKEHMVSEEMGDSGIRRLYMRLNQRDDLLEDLMVLRYCDIKGGRTRPDIADFDRFAERVFKVAHQFKTQSEKDKFQLAIDGFDIMLELGIPAGPIVGEVKQRLLDFAIEDPSRNTRDKLLRELHQYARSEVDLNV